MILIFIPELIEQAIAKLEFVNEVFMNTESYNNLNLTTEMSIITKPVLVIQGKLDYAIGVDQGKTIYKALKNVPESDKELVYLKKCSHNTPFESPVQYNAAMVAF